ncbi:hypothetical protein SRIMM317S_06008 [Streptomyces rimosus subsp. rimosus]
MISAAIRRQEISSSSLTTRCASTARARSASRRRGATWAGAAVPGDGQMVLLDGERTGPGPRGLVGGGHDRIAVPGRQLRDPQVLRRTPLRRVPPLSGPAVSSRSSAGPSSRAAPGGAHPVR